MSTGQGIETTLTDLVARELGLSRDAVRYRAGDTDDLPEGRGNGGSGATAVGGAATKRAVEKVIATGRALAAKMLDAKVEDIDFADGRFPLKGSNRSVGLMDVARYAQAAGAAGLCEIGEFMPPAVTFPNGCHMVEVEIDPDTGVAEIERYSIVEDIGTVLNPTLALGQIQGGVAMGVGQALGEAIVYDSESGQLISGSFMDYQMPRADDIPSVTLERAPCRRLSIRWAPRASARQVPSARWLPPSTPSAMRFPPWASDTSRCRRRPPASGPRSRMPGTQTRPGAVKSGQLSAPVAGGLASPAMSRFADRRLVAARGGRIA